MENKNLIYSITKYFDNYKSKEDLFQAGAIGLIKAYNNFNQDYNIKFTTYAYPYIVGEMKKLIREDKTIKVSRDLQKLSSKIEQLKNILSQKLMREPTIHELSLELNLSEYIIAEAMNSNYQVKSIDEPIKKDSKEITLNDIIPDNIEDINTLIALKQELSNLTEFEYELVKNRYMFDYTQQTTAEKLGISQVKVSRQEQKVLEKLRKKLV